MSRAPFLRRKSRNLKPTIIHCFFNVLHARSKNSLAGIDRFCLHLGADQNAVMHGADLCVAFLSWKAESREQAQDWAGSDPAIKAGRLVGEMHGPWDIDPSAINEPETTQGMEQYTLVLLKSGEKWNPSAPGFMDVIRQHDAVLQEMTEKGKIPVAGPFPLSDPGELRGVTIFRVGVEETAKLVRDDPTVKAGLLKTEIHPWITGKGVLASGQPTQ